MWNKRKEKKKITDNGDPFRYSLIFQSDCLLDIKPAKPDQDQKESGDVYGP